MKLKKGVKFDEGKPRWDLLPVREVEQVVETLTYGAGKYADNNWQLVVADTPGRCIAAAFRHFTARLKGKIIDDGPKGSGLPHLACAICNLLFLLWNDNEEERIHGTEKTKARVLHPGRNARPPAERKRRKGSPRKS